MQYRTILCAVLFSNISLCKKLCNIVWNNTGNVGNTIFLLHSVAYIGTSWFADVTWQAHWFKVVSLCQHITQIALADASPGLVWYFKFSRLFRIRVRWYILSNVIQLSPVSVETIGFCRTAFFYRRNLNVLRRDSNVCNKTKLKVTLETMTLTELYVSRRRWTLFSGNANTRTIYASFLLTRICHQDGLGKFSQAQSKQMLFTVITQRSWSKSRRRATQSSRTWVLDTRAMKKRHQRLLPVSSVPHCY